MHGSRRSGAVLAALLAIVCWVGSAEAQEEDAGWPRERLADDGSLVVVHQPQIEEWQDQALLIGDIALEIVPVGTADTAVAALRMQARTETDLESRNVVLFDKKILELEFVDAAADSAKLTQIVASAIENGARSISLDRLLSMLESTEVETTSVEVSLEPPTIFVSRGAARLVVINGDPALAEIKDTDLQFAVNTNWDLFYHTGEERYYLLDKRTWLISKELNGPWKAAKKLPGDFEHLPADSSWQHVREKVTGRLDFPDAIPKIYVSTEPAELILIKGEPRYIPIDSTRLTYLENTESDVFRDTDDGRTYFLVSGRWFWATSLDGPWSAVGQDLPADFSDIPAEHARGSVRSSVPGTPEADEAVRVAQIPQKAVVDRGEASVEVTYAGEPEFRAVEGTEMQYAVNTSADVILSKDVYWLCYQGVWFRSSTPQGPWNLADEVDSDIYSIPPSSPVYHVTYVKIYESTEETVTVGHTSGYTGVYVTSGVVVWGTGYYYDPWIYYGSVYPYYPVYYPYAYTYGAGTYYNPYTGTYARGAAAYGPYGGAGYAAAYNPATGTYARSAAAYGPYQAGRVSHAYNPRTQTSATSYQRANPYAQWGETVVQRGDKWAHTAHYAEDDGAIAGFRTSEGARGVGAVGDDASGGVIQTQSGDLYVGKDGDVYKRDDNGWSKRGDGDWSSVEVPDDRAQQASERVDGARAQDRASVQDRALAEGGAPTRANRSETARNRSWDGTRSSVNQGLRGASTSRSSGTQRTSDYRSWRSNSGSRSGNVRTGGGTRSGRSGFSGGGRRRR